MKSIKEIYQALLDGEKLKNKRIGGITTLETSALVHFDKPEDWEIYDKFAELKFAELKRVQAEGAIIEYETNLSGKWFVKTNNACWDADREYRIKGGITIEQWDAHKDLIKAWWDDAEIEYWSPIPEVWKVPMILSWDVGCKYRIK
jgi:hypothetical protein